MDATPSKSPRSRRSLAPNVDDTRHTNTGNKIKKPPPITPRRFTRFFTPRPRNPTCIVKTSRAALRTLSGSSLNARGTQSTRLQALSGGIENVTPRGKKRKLSFLVADTSLQSSPSSRLSISSASHDYIRSSPTIPERRTPTRFVHQDIGLCDTEDDTDIEVDEDEDDDGDEEDAFLPIPRIPTYRSKSVSSSLLFSRLTGRKVRKEVSISQHWQEETAHFYSDVHDINAAFTRPTAALPFSAAACHTNSLVAVGDEEGHIRLFDTSSRNSQGMNQAWLTMTPHDNAIMDLEFSPDDRYLATACGDQTCQIIDVQSQTSIYWLGDHRSSVKKIAFQPGSGNQVLASCGRDGQVNFWDLRCTNTPKNYMSQKVNVDLPMTAKMRPIAPTHMLRNAHTVGPRSKVSTSTRSRTNAVPGRSDFSITSLSFVGERKPHLLVTASEVDSAIKVWDIRTSYGASRKTPSPLSITSEPSIHAHHRSFGVTSIVLNGDGSRLYSLSRDHTVYVYATSHLILGSSNQLCATSKPSRAMENHQGLGPLYGFRHPSMRIQTFWPRLAIRKATDSQSEILAVGSSDDCAVLFPTDERYLTKATQEVPVLHRNSTMNGAQDTRDQSASIFGNSNSRPPLVRASSSSSLSFNSRLKAGAEEDPHLPLYRHGTPLVRGHDKEVTSLAWSFDGHLVTASDDYTVRCWRESPDEARKMRLAGEKNGIRWRKGWSDVGIENFDDDY